MTRFAGLKTAAAAWGLVSCCGCVSMTTKITGSGRAGSEQLLLTSTADKAVDSVDFAPLTGRKAYLDAARVAAADAGWITFGLRRQMARQGVLVVDDRKDADVLVEAAVAAYATDDVDCRVSLPTSAVMTALMPLPASSGSSSAESSLIRKSRQDSVVKLALFARDAKTNAVVWESGDVMQVDFLKRRFWGGSNITRKTSVPELETFPPRRIP